MKTGNTDCRRFQKRRDWIRQRLKFTVKITFFEAAIGTMRNDYTMSNNGFYSKLYFTMNSLEHR